MVDKKVLSEVQLGLFVIIFVSTMLSAAIIIPEDTDKKVIDSLHRIDGIEWKGFYSANPVRQNLEGAIVFSDADILPLISELLIILDPSYCTLEYLSGAIRNGCHLFLPEQLNLTTEDRKELIYLAKEGGTLIQVKNDFIFQPLNNQILSSDKGTCFIELHQSKLWEAGKLKKNILNNLLLVMLSCGEPFHRVEVFCGTANPYHPDVINIHINFINGSTASFTLEFSEQQPIHLMRIFHGKGLSTFDFMNRNQFDSIMNKTDADNSLLAEQIDALIKNIEHNTNPLYSLTEEIGVHLLMEKIKEKFDLHFCDILS